MAVTVDAVYEDGVLKPAQALPFREHEKVRVTVVPHSSWVQDTAGMFGWKAILRNCAAWRFLRNSTWRRIHDLRPAPDRGRGLSGCQHIYLPLYSRPVAGSSLQLGSRGQGRTSRSQVDRTCCSRSLFAKGRVANLATYPGQRRTKWKRADESSQHGPTLRWPNGPWPGEKTPYFLAKTGHMARHAIWPCEGGHGRTKPSCPGRLSVKTAKRIANWRRTLDNSGQKWTRGSAVSPREFSLEFLSFLPFFATPFSRCAQIDI